MGRLLNWVIALSLAVSVLYILIHVIVAQPVRRTQENGIITEDDPRWNCRTMGNHICGPDQP